MTSGIERLSALWVSQIEESTRTKVREFVQDPQVVEMHAMLKESLGKSSKWNEVEYWLL